MHIGHTWHMTSIYSFSSKMFKLPLAPRIQLYAMCCMLLHQNRVCVIDTIMGHPTCYQGPVMLQIHVCNIPVHPQSVTPFEEAHTHTHTFVCVCASQVLTSQWLMLQLWNQQQMRIEVGWNPEWHHCGSPETCNSKWLQNLLYLHLVDGFCTNCSSVTLLSLQKLSDHTFVCVCLRIESVLLFLLPFRHRAVPLVQTVNHWLWSRS
jgi:hypothetical protein